jgi:predicted dithiol-disulfide oxidoreductase (DUF899 family)
MRRLRHVHRQTGQSVPAAPERPAHPADPDGPGAAAGDRGSADAIGWSVPWYSSYGTSFNDDMGLTAFGLSVLIRDGDEVFRSYFTTARGVDRLRLDFNLLDLTPYGRQEQ